MKSIEMPNLLSPSVTRVLKWIAIFSVAILILLLVAGKILSSYVTREVRSKFEEAGGKIGDLDISLITRSITVSNIDFAEKGSLESSVASKAQIERVTLSRINVYQLIANKALLIGEAEIANGDVLFNRANVSEDTVASNDKKGLQQLSIERVTLTDINFSIVNDSINEYSGVLNAYVNGINSSDTAGIAEVAAYDIDNLEFQINGLKISNPKLYSIEIGNIAASSNDSNLNIDSIRLTPKYEKFKFAKVAGKQIDRINTFIRKIEIDGLKYDHLRDSSFVASKIKIIEGEVHSFRDKREPFKETKVKPLPIAALREVNFGVKVDTIMIQDSKVEYEEFAPEGFESGTIVFEDLNAVLTNLTNLKDSIQKEYATLNASAKLMGEAQIDATFQLPYDERKPYVAKGTIGGMPLENLNSPLQNLAFVRIQSGTLEGLTFNFTYDDISSNGKVTINYRDLKIDGLKKDKKNVINDLKTLLINTVIKNDKDKEVPLEKRTGNVNFERDRKRQIFNFWWKSLFSGIKSSVIDS